MSSHVSGLTQSEGHQLTCPSQSPRRTSIRRWSVLFIVLPLSILISKPMSAATTRASTPTGPLSSSEVLKDSSVIFPITPVGQSSTICRALCFCPSTASCSCNGSGTQTIEHPLAPPFSVSGFRIQPYANGTYDCNRGTPVQLPVFLNAGQQTVFTISFAPTRTGTFNDHLTLSDYTFHLSGSTPRGSVSLIPYKPTGWSAPVVVSNTEGTQVDSPTLRSTEPLYVSWAVLNAGDLSTTGTFYTDLLLDSRLLTRTPFFDALSPNFYIYLKDIKIGPLAPGTHTLDLMPDSTHSTLGPIQNFKKTFTVTQGAPIPKPPPLPTTSWYVYVADKETDQALNSWAYNAGYQYGQNAISPSGFVVLDFGQPWQSGQTYGTWSFDPRFGRFLSTSAIREAVKQYVRGFIVGSAGNNNRLWLGVGTNNYGSYVTAGHGKAWANMMTALQAWLDTSGGAQKVFLRAASDIELGYSTPDKASSWTMAYNGANSLHFLYNYGDAQGCPQSGTSNVPKPCSGKAGWTQDKVIRNSLLLLPQIYSTAGGNAKQWQQLILYYYLRYNHKIAVSGVTSQKQACQQRDGCQGIDNSPAQAWTQLRDRLASDPRTLTVSPSFSTDFKWRK